MAGQVRYSAGFVFPDGTVQTTANVLSSPLWLSESGGTLYYNSGNVGIGTTNPAQKLSVNGTIRAKEIIVDTNWSDYVFHPNYRLRPLSEVATYVGANHHLPEVPSEAEVQEKGISLGDMQSRLLAKIEELTLYVIQQERENHELRESLTRENQALRLRVAQLEQRVAGAPAADLPVR